MAIPHSHRPPSARLVWLDSLRGVAVLGVVLVHTGQLARRTPKPLRILTESGQFGVQLFFIVSAITIGLTYESHIRRFGNSLFSNAGWFTKRFFRIAPLYYLAAIFYVGVAWLNHAGRWIPDGRGQLEELLANLLFIHTWVPSANNSVVPGGWSIGAEMFFYLTVPLLFIFRRDRTRVLVLLLLTPVCLLSLAHAGELINNSYLYYWFPSQFPVFAVGLCLYFLGVKRNATSRLHPGLLIAFATLFVSGATLSRFTGWAVLATPLLIGASFACLVLGGNPATARLFQSKVLAYIGRISFSVYLVHFAVIDALYPLVKKCGLPSVVAQMVLYPSIAGVTILIAGFTKKYVEDPGVKLGQALADRLGSACLRKTNEARVLVMQ
ncbi:MAG TPA: acyltransferase [Terracidiphilus sp.]|nr:acyltransferase [Terracidiphilus sp.]